MTPIGQIMHYTKLLFLLPIAVADYDPDPQLIKEVNKAYSVLDPLLKTDLTIIPKKYSPLSSRGVREKRSTMVRFHTSKKTCLV